MSTQLLEIQSKELKFTIELKKQSSCSVRLANNTQHHVAFKVKTTSPKRYCVRPNVGVVLPQSGCDFTVIMQAHKMAPPDMVCNDKFLIQSTIVPPGTTEEDITSDTFAKGSGKNIEENKLRVVLISPPPSPVPSQVSPVNGGSKKGLFESAESDHEKSSPNEQFHGVSKLKDENGHLDEWLFHGTSKLNAQNGVIEDEGLVYRASKLKDQSPTSFDIIAPPNMIYEDFQHSKAVDSDNANLVITEESEVVNKVSKPPKNTNMQHLEEVDLRPVITAVYQEAPNSVITEESKVVNEEKSKPPRNTKLQHSDEVDHKTVINMEELKLAGDIDKMKSKLYELELKLSKAQVSISRLTEERKNSIQEIKILQERLAEMSKRGQKKVRGRGFPPLFICMVALICIVLGYISHR